MNLRVCLVQHNPGGKLFLFDCGDIELYEGSEVVCDTRRGQSYGKLACDPITVSAIDPSAVELLLRQMGARMPLGRVVPSPVIRLTDAQKEEIAKQWIRMHVLEELPF